MAPCCFSTLKSVQRQYDGSATTPSSHLGYALARGPGGCLGPGAVLGGADRRVGTAAQPELHQLLQAPVLRSARGQATTSDVPLGQETRWAARSSPSPPGLGP